MQGIMHTDERCRFQLTHPRALDACCMHACVMRVVFERSYIQPRRDYINVYVPLRSRNLRSSLSDGINAIWDLYILKAWIFQLNYILTVETKPHAWSSTRWWVHVSLQATLHAFVDVFLKIMQVHAAAEFAGRVRRLTLKSFRGKSCPYIYIYMRLVVLALSKI